MSSIPGGLNAATDPSLGAFTSAQNRAILIVGLSCSCVSLIATLITLRWFLLMKRLFRHRLVLYLILSDFFKAFWYFVFPLVVFTRGEVKTSSTWCQASGWLLSFAIEASDFSILLIALHAMLYIFRPPVRIGKGGLYKYRNWIPLVWLGPPAISASLAFINSGEGYITAGNFCYLPKRPIWYRLALAYIPRYVILITIFTMYAAISVYVHVKFRGFREIVAPDSGSGYGSDLERSTSHSDSVTLDDMVAPDEIVSPERAVSPPPPIEKKSHNGRPGFGRGNSYRAFQESLMPQQQQPQHLEPWDAMNFITSKPLHDTGMHNLGIQASDFASTARGSASSEETRVANGDVPFHLNTPNFGAQKSRQVSDVPTMNTMQTDDTRVTPAASTARAKKISKELKMQDPLQRARYAIRQQLRFLFIYPAVYALMWAFPFAQNCTLYSDYYAAHPLFWLQIMSTACLSLQAAVDCLVFSWREKPWRRVDQKSKFSIPFWRAQSVTFISGVFSPHSTSRKGTTATEETPPLEPVKPARAPSPNWWEAEGKKRKDSVWMGTDLLSKFTSKQSDGDQAAKMETIEERAGSV